MAAYSNSNKDYNKDYIEGYNYNYKHNNYVVRVQLQLHSGTQLQLQ